MSQIRIDAPSAAIIAALCLAPFATAQSDADIIGFTDLALRLGSAVPDGADVFVGQVESNTKGPGSYAPFAGDSEFLGKTFTLMSGASIPSGHANFVGYSFYGLTTSIAPGIVDIFNYEANNWATAAYLLSGGATEPLDPPVGLKIFNNSWVGAFGTPAGNNNCLRRADFAVIRDDVLMINGVNNAPPSQALMSMMYNGLAVGLRSGLHDTGDVIGGIDGVGRQKPEIVAPGQFTSFSTPIVSSVAALLVEIARTDAALTLNPAAERTEVLKAVMLAGAKKEDAHGEDWTNNPATSGPTRGVTATPIDHIVGVGTVNVDTGHLILTRGEQDGSSTVPAIANIEFVGWDLATVGIGQSRYFRFRLNEEADAVTFAATWHRRSTPPTFVTSFPGNFNLFLWRISKGTTLATLVGDPGLPWFNAGNVTSESAVDNLEYIHVNGLEPGNYALELRRIDAVALQPTYDVGVAWIMPEPTCIPADLNCDGLVNGLDLALLLGDWGACPPSPPSFGGGRGAGGEGCPADFDASGFVNGLDLAILLGAWG